MLGMMFDGSIGSELTIIGTLVILGSALIMGFLISLIYMFTHRDEGYSAGFVITLIMLPAIIAMIILLVGNNVARAFSLAGAFSLIRFRSAPGDAKDMTYVFFSLGVGLACGMGYMGYGAVFATVLCGVMTILNAVNFGKKKRIPMQLKVVIPEDIDYMGLFDDVLQLYTKNNKLVRVKTSEFGSLFELTYEIMISDISESKRFIDALRCKNGNLNIAITTRVSESTGF